MLSETTRDPVSTDSTLPFGGPAYGYCTSPLHEKTRFEHDESTRKGRL